MKVPRLSSALLTILLAGAATAQPSAGFKRQTVATGLDAAVAMAFAPDGRLFVAERNTGNIRVLHNGTLGGVWARVNSVASNSSEAGLLGIAIDPDFLQSGHVYVFVTQPASSWQHVVGRLKEVGGVGTGFTPIWGPLPGTGRHVGGPIAFGGDRKLYVACGEQGLAPMAQSLGNPFGKMLRLEPDGSTPTDNPFVGRPGADAQIWSYGHRNPFGLAVHPRTGVPYVSENGGGYDEVNRLVKGGNFGWPIYMGPEPTPDPTTEDALWSKLPEPSLTGACFYSGSLYPTGFADDLFVTAWKDADITRLEMDATGTTVAAATTFDSFTGTVLDIADGPDGNLWALTNDQSERGCRQITRYVHDNAPTPSANLTAVSGYSVGAAVTLGVVARNGDTVVSWLAARKLNTPVTTPFGLLEVPPDLVLPAVVVAADDRVYLGVPIPDNPLLRGNTLHAQAGIVGAAGNALTNATSLGLR